MTGTAARGVAKGRVEEGDLMRHCLVMTAALLMVFIMAGCATVVPRTAQAPCLPPGIGADVFLWPVVGSGTVGFLRLEGGGTVAMNYVVYERVDRRVAIGWAGSQIFMVDPEPDSARAPWFNDAIITAHREIRPAPPGRCQWSRAADTQA
jgi:hypothetical protein